MTTLALIGTGRWGKNYLATVNKIPNVTIKYICTRQKDVTNISEYIHVTDYKKLIEFNDIDGIIIATPADTHYEIAAFLIKNNINIIIEKPLTTNLKDAKKLQKIYEKANKPVVMVGHIYLYNPAYISLKERFKNLKNVNNIYSEGSNWGSGHLDRNSLWDWAPHDVSMYVDLLGMPNAVQAWGNTLRNDEMIFARLFYPNGLSVFFRVGWLSPEKVRKMTIVTEEESLIYNDLLEDKVMAIKNDSRIMIEYKKAEPLSEELKDFINCIKKKEQTKSSLLNGVDVISILDALEKSIKQRGRVKKVKI